MILSPEELEQLTRKTERAQKRYGSQAEVLKALHIPFLPRPDKTLIVYRCFVDPHGKTEKESVDAPTVLL
jgi:hypothetical protein